MLSTISRFFHRSTPPALILTGFLLCAVGIPVIDTVFTGERVPVIGALFISEAAARPGGGGRGGGRARPAPRRGGDVTRHTAPRHTTRRQAHSPTRHRHVTVGVRVNVLPAGCTSLRVSNISYYRCGTYYYQPYYEGTTVVYVVVDEP